MSAPWIGWVSTAVVCIIMVGVARAKIELAMIQPDQTILQNVLNRDYVDFDLLIAASEEDVLPAATVVCATEIAAEHDLVGDNKLCIDRGKFRIVLANTGTHLTNITLEVPTRLVGHDNAEQQTVLAFQTILIEVALKWEIENDGYLLAKSISKQDPTINSLDYLFISHTRSSPDANDLANYRFTAITSAHTLREPVYSSVRKNVAIFARSAPHFGASDRFYDWLREHRTFSDRGIDLVVIAPEDPDQPGAAAICGVPVFYFACLREDSAASIMQHALDHTHILLDQQPSTAPLAQYLTQQRVQAVLVVNTYGDAQTSLLLEVAHAVKVQVGGDLGQGGAAAATLRHWPVVLMDLPNLGLPSKWHHRVDGFIAPSRAAAMHDTTTMHGLPVAAIYPPVRNLVIQNSICYPQYISAMQRYSLLVDPSSGATVQDTLASAPAISTALPPLPPVPALPLTPALTLPPGVAIDKIPQEDHHEMLLPANKFNVLYVGRLARVKSPGVLIRALGYALAIDYNSYTAAERSEYRTELNRIAVEYSQLTESVMMANISNGNPVLEPVNMLLRDFAADVLVTYVGGGRAVLAGALRGLAAGLNVSSLVDLQQQRGQQVPQRVVRYMQQAQVLVNPRLTGETFGFVHVEAAAQGLPVIAFDTGANSESVQFFRDKSSNNSSNNSIDNSDNSTENSNNNSSDTCAGVQSVLVPYREGAAVQDLALALLRAYVQHKSAHLCTHSGATMDINKISSVCETVLPLFEHWDAKQHSLALVEAIELFLQ